MEKPRRFRRLVAYGAVVMLLGVAVWAPQALGLQPGALVP